MRRQNVDGMIIAAATGFALAGCGSGAKAALTCVTVPTTTTVATPQAGATVRCTNRGISARAKVPPRGHGTGVVADGTASSASLQLTRRADGSLEIVCSP